MNRKPSKAKPILAAALGALLSTGQAATPQDLDRGKALVEANCARCHAIGRDDESRHPDAPAFRTLSQRYPLDALEEAFAEGISTGHPDMPEFIATPEQIEAILAYIGSVQDQ